MKGFTLFCDSSHPGMIQPFPNFSIPAGKRVEIAVNEYATRLARIDIGDLSVTVEASKFDVLPW